MKPSMHVLLFTVAAVAIVTGCGGSSSSGPGRLLISITVQPASADATEPGGSFLFSALGSFDQQPTTDFVSAQWSTGDPTIATIDGTGLATCIADGSVIVSASTKGKAGTLTSDATLNCDAAPPPPPPPLSGVCLATSPALNF